MIPSRSTEAVDRAFDKFELFHNLHLASGVDNQLEAISAFQEGLGLSDEAKTRVYDRVLRFRPRDSGEPFTLIGWMLVGIFIGLLIAEEDC